MSKEEEYKQVFLAEAKDLDVDLQKNVSVLKKNTGDKKSLEEVFRLVHTIKGNANALGFSDIGTLGEIIEDIFSVIKASESSIDEAILLDIVKGIDKISEQISAIETGEKVKFLAVKTRLSIVLKKLKQGDGFIAANSETPVGEKVEEKPKEIEESKPEIAAEENIESKAKITVEKKDEKATNDDVSEAPDKSELKSKVLKAVDTLSNLFKNINGLKDFSSVEEELQTLVKEGADANEKGVKQMSEAFLKMFTEIKENNLSLNDEHQESIDANVSIFAEVGNALTTGDKVKYIATKAKLGVVVRKLKEDKAFEANSETEEEVEEVKEATVEKTEHVETAETQKVEGFDSDDEGDEDVKEEYKEIFFSEANENSEELNKLFTKLEQNKKNRSAVDAIFRITHTLKGNALGIGLKAIGGMAHVLEDVFGEVREGKLQLTDAIFKQLFRGLDTLTAQIQALKSNDKVEHKKIKSILHSILKGEFDESKLSPEDENVEEDDSAGKMVFADSVQVPVKKLDDLMNLVGELVIERDRLISMVKEEGEGKNVDFSRFVRITSDLQYSVMDVRLVQISFLFNKFHRVVRDAGSIEKKKVQLELAGTETEIDRNVISVISDSMIHLVRNCVGHGIETPEERVKAGKNEVGTLTLNAKNESDNVIIQIIDDGKGIDPAVIGKKAIEKGLITPEALKAMPDKEIIMYIFEPGFSSMDTVTAISGRGVGMDVVRKSIDSIGGNIEVSSEVGKGTTITLFLPSSMAVKGTLLFELGDQEFAMPLAYTEAVVSYKKSDFHKVSKGLMATHLNKNISIVFLHDIFNDENAENKNRLHASYDELDDDKQLDVVIVSYSGRNVGFVVDKLLQQKEIVEKPLMKPVSNIPFVSGVTILGNGKVCLVLNVMTIVQHIFMPSAKQILMD